MTDGHGPDAPSVFPGFGDITDDLVSLVDRLAESRRRQGLSQTEVAARMRTSQSAVARLEAHRGDVRLSTLTRYARALDHSLRFGVVADAGTDRSPTAPTTAPGQDPP